MLNCMKRLYVRANLEWAARRVSYLEFNLSHMLGLTHIQRC